MAEYLFTFFVLLVISAVAYLAYEHFLRPTAKTGSELYQEALRDLLDGRQEKAFSKLRQVIAEDSGNIDAYLRLGKILRDNKKPDKALQVHKDLTLRTGLSSHEKVEVLEQLYADFFELGEFDQAQAALKELISVDPRDRRAHINLLKLQEKAGHWDEAYDSAVKILKLEGNKSKKPLAGYKFHMAEELYKKREYHKARILFKEALGLDPTCVQAYLMIGDSYLEEKRFEDAVNFFNKLIDAVPDQGHLVIERLKKTLFTLGRFGDIVDICENILKHSPKNLEARLTLAEFYDKKGDTTAAEQMLAEIVEETPENTKAVCELIRLYLARDDKKKIKELIRDIEHRREKMKSASVSKIVDTSLIGIR
ncbi:MAG: tetratricopeptide repeat protein [candidate division Zixibacteria bacterium]|nr:tetratricopeptide repeat protein [candidate division Zixibacteria bacterium]